MRALAVLVSTATLVGLTGCESLPGSRTQQTTVAGGAAGAAAGAFIGGEGNRLVGALIGGALGAGGGYLIGAETGWFGDEDADERARSAIERAKEDPASISDVHGASTADLNGDGFVTTDELVAMEEAGLSDAEMLERLRATGQVFDLSEAQRRHLVDAGVSPSVVDEMPELNAEAKERALGDAGVLGRTP